MMKHFVKVRKNNQGFTLVELMIVVAIIGILAAIAIPQFAKYRINAAIASVEGDIKSCATELVAEFAEDGTLTNTCVGNVSTETLTVDAAGNFVAKSAAVKVGKNSITYDLTATGVVSAKVTAI